MEPSLEQVAMQGFILDSPRIRRWAVHIFTAELMNMYYHQLAHIKNR